MIVYAQASDLETWLGPATLPDDVDQQLRSASLIVARAGNRNPYTDTPSTTDAAALKDATCAQVATWIKLGISPAAVGLDTAPVRKSSILGADVERDTTGQVTAFATAATDLVPEARAILLQSGLLWQPLPLGADDSDRLPSWGQGVPRWLPPFLDPLSGEYDWPTLSGWPSYE